MSGMKNRDSEKVPHYIRMPILASFLCVCSVLPSNGQGGVVGAVPSFSVVVPTLGIPLILEAGSNFHNQLDGGIFLVCANQDHASKV